jgi:integrase
MGEQGPRRRMPQQGVIDVRPSGALRVRVDAGIDPVTGRRHRLVEHVAAGTPNQEAVAEQVRIRLVNQVNERRHPRTSATVSQLLDRYLDAFDGAFSTVKNYRSLRKNHVEPFIGSVRVGALDADILDSLYAELRRCRSHCTGPFVEHRTDGEHACDARCRPHRCTPLGSSGIRQVHWMLSGAFRSAVRWKWVSTNPVSEAEPGRPPQTNPQPPSGRDAARIVAEAASTDLDWATLIWLAMTTGARRHELCALRWTDVLIDEDGVAVLWIRRGISRNGEGVWAEMDTKTHQQRRVTLDPETVSVLREHRARVANRLHAAGLDLAEGAFVFSAEVDHSRFLHPGSVSQRYERLVDRLGIQTTIHKLRHYSATELIKGGVDINTVAGRLGHGGGGTTTLKYYTGWVAEAEQRAAISLGARMPQRDWRERSAAERAIENPRNPYEVVACAVRQAILAGDYAQGDPAPTVTGLAAAHNVSDGTAHRALELLKTWGLITGGRRGVRHTIVIPADPQPVSPAPSVGPVSPAAPVSAVAPVSPEVSPAASPPAPVSSVALREPPASPPDLSEALDLQLVRLGRTVRTYRTEADPANTSQLLALLMDAVRRVGGDDTEVSEYELVVRYAGERGVVTTVVAPPTLGDRQRRPGSAA